MSGKSEIPEIIEQNTLKMVDDLKKFLAEFGVNESLDCN